MNGIPNSLNLYKVTFHGESYVLAESEDKARKIYREDATYLNEVIDEINWKAKYNQVEDV